MLTCIKAQSFLVGGFHGYSVHPASQSVQPFYQNQD